MAEQAFEEHDKAIEEIQKSFEPPTLLFDGQNNAIPGDSVDPNCLSRHADLYKSFTQRFREDMNNDRWSYKKLLTEIADNPIYCVKYNYTLEKALMNHLQFDCKLELSSDGQ